VCVAVSVAVCVAVCVAVSVAVCVAVCVAVSVAVCVAARAFFLLPSRDHFPIATGMWMLFGAENSNVFVYIFNF